MGKKTWKFEIDYEGEKQVFMLRRLTGVDEIDTFKAFSKFNTDGSPIVESPEQMIRFNAKRVSKACVEPKMTETEVLGIDTALINWIVDKVNKINKLDVPLLKSDSEAPSDSETSTKTSPPISSKQ